MQAAAIDQFGGVDELRLQTLPVPEVGPEEVLIRVESVGVGAWDPWEREGRFRELFREMHGSEPTFPYVIGFDGAGTVAAVGEAVTRFEEGDRVYADRHLNPKGRVLRGVRRCTRRLRLPDPQRTDRRAGRCHAGGRNHRAAGSTTRSASRRASRS